MIAEYIKYRIPTTWNCILCDILAEREINSQVSMLYECQESAFSRIDLRIGLNWTFSVIVSDSVKNGVK